MANLDFTGIPTNEPLAEGIYNFVIEEVEEKTSSAGNPMFQVRYKETETNTAVFENYVLTPNCLWKLKELTDALGIEVAPGTDSSELIPALKGEMVKAKVIQDTYEGRVTNRVKKVLNA